MIVLAIDPGPELSAYVRFSTANRQIVDKGKVPNREMLAIIYDGHTLAKQIDRLVVEMIASYGMAVGASVFDTCVWIGRYIEAWGGEHTDAQLVYRRDVKLHMCGSMRAKDANVRAAVLDRYGGNAAIGNKRNPGALYGVSGDMWQALAVAVTYADTHALDKCSREKRSSNSG